jgi:hypothetical protein
MVKKLGISLRVGRKRMLRYDCRKIVIVVRVEVQSEDEARLT